MRTDDRSLYNAIKIFKETLFPMSVVVVGALNVWLVYKLAPITQGAAIVETRVSANEDRIEGVKESMGEGFTAVANTITALDNRLTGRVDGVDGKLDKALEYIYTCGR